MFGKQKVAEKNASDPLEQPIAAGSDRRLIVSASDEIVNDAAFFSELTSAVSPLEVVKVKGGTVNVSQNADEIRRAQNVLSVFQDPETLDRLLDAVIAARSKRNDGFPTLVIAVPVSNLGNFGTWLYRTAKADRLQGIRLLAGTTPHDILAQLPNRLQPVKEPNVIKMPISPEVENSGFKYFYTISPQLRDVVKRMKELAENNVIRIYLLGGPGTGKTSVAYYYWLNRNKGNFVAVNLTAESTDDKASMKSLLCGHVAGSIAGTGSREGSLSYAGQGVCFLDESHGVTGVVMQVLMEVLDSGQYLPFGATKKRMLECAVIFASNRSWEALRAMVNLDEHARLGASILYVPDLSKREEDLIAVVGSCFSDFAERFKSWGAPQGFTPEAWALIKSCAWHGNLRTLIRVCETAAIEQAMLPEKSPLIEAKQVQYALDLWEPTEHESLKIYTSH